MTEARPDARALRRAGPPGRRAPRPHLADRTTLLVLDNFEHLLDAANDVPPLLARGAGSRIVVTSRAPLRVAGEQIYPVPPLDDAAGGPAERLFVERARAAVAGWSPRSRRGARRRNLRSPRRPAPRHRARCGTRRPPAARRDPRPFGGTTAAAWRRPARPAGSAAHARGDHCLERGPARARPRQRLRHGSRCSRAASISSRRRSWAPTQPRASAWRRARRDRGADRAEPDRPATGPSARESDFGCWRRSAPSPYATWRRPARR